MCEPDAPKVKFPCNERWFPSQMGDSNALRCFLGAGDSRRKSRESVAGADSARRG